MLYLFTQEGYEQFPSDKELEEFLTRHFGSKKNRVKIHQIVSRPRPTMFDAVVRVWDGGDWNEVCVL